MSMLVTAVAPPNRFADRTTCQENAKRTPSVPLQINQLSDAVTELDSVIDALRSRLDPVMSDGPPQPVSNEVPPHGGMPSTGCTVSDAICTHAILIRQKVLRLSQMLDRLEI